MKLNKTLIIAALLAGAMLATDAVRAQDATNAPAATSRPAPRARNFDYYATQLALTDDQKAKAKPVIDDMLQKMVDLRKDTSMEAADKRAKAKEIREEATTKLKDILTPDQLQKWQKLAGGRRAAGGAGAAPTAPASNDTKPQQ